MRADPEGPGRFTAREVGRRALPGRLRGAAHRPPADGDPGADGQGRRLGAHPLRRRLLQAAQLDVAAVQGARGHVRRRTGRVDRDRQGRRHAADPDRGDPARLVPRPRHRPRPAEGRRREAPPGAARRAPRHARRGADPGPSRVPDRDRAGRPHVPGRRGPRASPSRSSAAATSTASSSSPATSSSSTATRCSTPRAPSGASSPPRRSSRRRASSPRTAASPARRSTTTPCAASTTRATGCSNSRAPEHAGIPAPPDVWAGPGRGGQVSGGSVVSLSPRWAMSSRAYRRRSSSGVTSMVPVWSRRYW